MVGQLTQTRLTMTIDSDCKSDAVDKLTFDARGSVVSFTFPFEFRSEGTAVPSNVTPAYLEDDDGVRHERRYAQGAVRP
jgi:hypothetical protein